MIKVNVVEVDKSIILFLAFDLMSYEVVGKCSLKIRKNNLIRYQDAFIEASNRGKGVYKKLFIAREAYIKEHYDNYVIESYCKKSTLHLFTKSGFKIKSKLYLVERNNNFNNLKVVS